MFAATFSAHTTGHEYICSINDLGKYYMNNYRELAATILSNLALVTEFGFPIHPRYTSVTGREQSFLITIKPEHISASVAERRPITRYG
ncbi:hypothetical protein PG990_009569 [Apiospora arundinis]